MSGAHKWMLELAILVIGLRGTDCDKILRSAYTGLVAGCVIIILLGASGVISGNTVTRSGIVRLSLGFYHPNILGMRFFQIIAFFIFLNLLRHHLWFQMKQFAHPFVVGAGDVELRIKKQIKLIDAYLEQAGEEKVSALVQQHQQRD